MFRSTKGASKHRRDLINSEILKLRDMLPLSESTRQRLSQLQIMSLTCVYIRKCAHLSKIAGCAGTDSTKAPFEFSQTLSGFLMVTTKDGKLLYVSENVIEYLGHSAVDMMTQGDTIYDITDKRDHATAQAQLLHGSYTAGSDGEQVFFCRMNVSRSFRRQTGYGDHKVMHVRGRFMVPPDQYGVGSQPVFVAVCSPLLTPDAKPPAAQSTMTFTSVHALDMSYREVAPNTAYHLGYSEEDLFGTSWYDLLHPDDVMEAKEKHKQLVTSSHEMGCMLTARLQAKYGGWVWVNMVLHVRQPFACDGAVAVDSAVTSIVCVNQVIGAGEAMQYRQQSQLFASHAAQASEFLLCRPDVGPGSPAVDSLQSEPCLYYQGELVTVPGIFAGQPGDVRPDGAQFSGVGCFTERLEGADQSPPPVDRKSDIRAGILNRLKRKVTEMAAAGYCKAAKKPRAYYSDEGSAGFSPQRRVSYVGGAVVAGRAGGGAVTADAQVFRAGSFTDDLFGQLLLRKTAVEAPSAAEALLMSECADMPFMSLDSLQELSVGMAPLTPDHVAGDDLCAVSRPVAAVPPPCLPTPDASPAGSPLHRPDSPDSAEQCVPSLWQDIEDALAVSVDCELASATTTAFVKPARAKLPAPAAPKRRLPELDVDTLEDFLLRTESDVSGPCDVSEEAPAADDVSQLDGALKDALFEMAQSAARLAPPVGVPGFRQGARAVDCQPSADDGSSSAYEEFLDELMSSQPSALFGDDAASYSPFFNDQTL